MRADLEATLFEQMKSYVGFEADDAAALNTLAATVGPHLEDIVADFYDRIDDEPGAQAVVAAHSSRERLSKTLLQWLREFLDGPYDAHYYQRRARIGQVHVRIGLPPHYVFTAMNVLRLGLIPHATTEQRVAVHKLMDLELGIINNVYWDHIGAELQRNERLATIGELAGSFAHEIRNPLSAMQNAAYFLNYKIGSGGDERVQRHLEVMRTKVEECNRLVGSLLEFARERQPISSEIPMRALLTSVREEVAADGAPVNVTIPEEMITFTGDEVQLRALLRNLVRNAQQAVGDAGSVSMSLSVTDRAITIEVADDGVGIEADMLEKIFAPLVTTKTYGLGLGLPYCRRVARAHGGSLAVTSTLGQGSTFTLELPR